MERVTESVYWLGVFGSPNFISIYLVRGAQLALIESGPSAIAGEILEEIVRSGFKPSEISHILVTHIHVDHAGGAWSLLEKMPDAKVWVYYAGAKHLINPTRLKASALNVVGDTLKLWGDIQPIKTQRVKSVYGEEVLDLGGSILKFIPAPGHAFHQMCIYEENSRVLFPGDALGVYYPEADIIIPASPRPGFDLKVSLQTMRMLSQLPIDIIAFPHYAPFKGADQAFPLCIKAYETWERILRRGMDEGLQGDQLIDKLFEELEEYHVLAKTPGWRESLEMHVVGFVDYLERTKA